MEPGNTVKDTHLALYILFITPVKILVHIVGDGEEWKKESIEAQDKAGGMS